MRKALLGMCFLFVAPIIRGQAYTSWHTGSISDVATQASGGICMMGGATEHDGAMRWFLERAQGGDVLVLRASGSDGYNTYLYSDLGVPVNSVVTIRFNNAGAAQDPYVHERIQQAEAIWFAGGDQWNYVNYWRGTPVDSLINAAIAERNIVVGGTSAGMAILGGIYFTAQNGTVSSASALANPYAPAMTVSADPFLVLPWMGAIVTDSHYDSPDRRARHMAFMARAITDHGLPARGIACNEYVAVCVDGTGLARVFGEWPAYEEYAYFLQPNCLTSGTPEVCTPGTPLTWDHDGAAVKVYKVPGTMEGTNTFDLDGWLTGTGGGWEDWSSAGGVFTAALGAPAADCASSVGEGHGTKPLLRTLGDGCFTIVGVDGAHDPRVTDMAGRAVPVVVDRRADEVHLRVPASVQGLLLVEVFGRHGRSTFRIVAHEGGAIR